MSGDVNSIIAAAHANPLMFISGISFGPMVTHNVCDGTNTYQVLGGCLGWKMLPLTLTLM